MGQRLRSFVANLTLLLGSVLGTALVVELGMRALGLSYVSFHRPDDKLGLRLRERAEGWYTSEGRSFVRINSRGFRDEERTVEKPAATFRVVVLGDSYVEALQVDRENTFVALLEQQLNQCRAFGGRRVEVLNFGVSGYGTAQQLLTFRLFAAKYSPDLVVSAVFAGNDVRNNSMALEPDKLRPFFVLRDGALIQDDSFATSDEFKRRTNRLRKVLDTLRALRIVQAAYLVKDRLQLPASPARNQAPEMFEPGLDDEVYAEPASAAWIDAWSVTERLFDLMNQEVRAAGASLMLVSLSTGLQVHPDPQQRTRFTQATRVKDVFYPERRLAALVKRLDIDSVALAPGMQEIAQRDKLYFHGFANTRLGTGHWNEAGHRAAATALAGHLCGGHATKAP